MPPKQGVWPGRVLVNFAPSSPVEMRLPAAAAAAVKKDPFPVPRAGFLQLLPLCSSNVGLQSIPLIGSHPRLQRPLGHLLGGLIHHQEVNFSAARTVRLWLGAHRGWTPWLLGMRTSPTSVSSAGLPSAIRATWPVTARCTQGKSPTTAPSAEPALTGRLT